MTKKKIESSKNNQRRQPFVNHSKANVMTLLGRWSVESLDPDRTKFAEGVDRNLLLGVDSHMRQLHKLFHVYQTLDYLNHF